MNILVVDDSKTIRFMLTRLLNELGYNQINEASDVEAAMLQIRRNPPDLIFSDFNMPGKNGLDFLKLVRQHPTIGQVPFIMVTTVHDKGVIFEAVKSGLQHYIFKPVEKNLLIDKLSGLAESHHIQPPIKVAKTHWEPIPEDKPKETTNPKSSDKTGTDSSSQVISEEQTAAILEHFYLLFDGEITMQDFQTWAKDDCLPHLPEQCKIKSPQQFLDLLRSAATIGIKEALKKCNS